MDDGWQSAVSGLKEVLARFKDGGLGDAALPDQQRADRRIAFNLTERSGKTTLRACNGGRSSAWLEPQIVDLAVAGSNPVDHPIFFSQLRCVSLFPRQAWVRKWRPPPAGCAVRSVSKYWTIS